MHEHAFSSVEVGGAADVVVRNGRPVRGGCGPIAIVVPKTGLIGIRLEDRLDGSVRACADGERV